jgi:hypothetical protein
MSTISTTIVAIAYRNFNLCPHCVFQGEQKLLRLCERIPMISRPDGQLFHLLLADQPMPYPAETESGPTTQISVCFWYSRAGKWLHRGDSAQASREAECAFPRDR